MPPSYPSPGPFLAPPPYPGPPPFPPPVIANPPDDPFFWFGADALLWWVKSQPLGVPLITTGPASQGANAGSLGAPGTTSLNGPLNFNPAAGLQLYMGSWFDSAHTIGLDGGFFYLGRQSTSFGAADRSGTGQFVINEPVVGAPFSTLVSYPGVETGSVNVNATTQLTGADVNILYNLMRKPGWTVNLVGGFRFVELDETLSINANSDLFVTTTYYDGFGNVLATAPPGSSVVVIDSFNTKNQFYGGQLGAYVQRVLGRWVFNATGKVALGATHEVVNVQGTTYVNPINGPSVALAGGNFATLQAGQWLQNQFAVLPQFQGNVGYQIGRCVRASIGYNFLFLSRVVRPGNQIDNTYDGVVHPLVPMTNSTFWAQGINFSLLFSF
jgi:hypothetical protein